ncbi:glycosyltransferase family 2 protein [Romboutsia sp. Marseille-P6047]|uniref:glycosyltransferase family 2 protein n=1 Tax=Romboutsia sp. Marseille-P6047 TaxID=2161817 RepID=UPI000F0671D4|nr:glycosyltransferase family 2 protein [Romboutsia sp. Marseille-P6047]
MNPIVSIIIPMYNVELYIKECLESCIKQTYKNFEIIIIDDNSEDNSLSIAKDILKIKM